MLYTAVILGFFGSLHCAGMCGPLALAVSGPNCRARIAYNSGRITTYALIGLLVGLFGRTLALAGIQRWLSIGAGVVILVGLGATSRKLAMPLAIHSITKVKRLFGALLTRNSLSSQLGLGILNGFLPCGLVYTAAAAALAAGGPVDGMIYMVLFGLGTTPMLVGMSIAGNKLSPAFRFKLQGLVPAAVSAVALLLILRGLSLGFPYLSPDISTEDHAKACCTRH